MATANGTAILSFGSGARSAVNKIEKVVTDSMPNVYHNFVSDFFTAPLGVYRIGHGDYHPGLSKFFMYSTFTNEILQSSNGIFGEVLQIAPIFPGRLQYSNGFLFVTPEGIGSTIYRSSNGTSWTASNTIVADSIWRIAYGNGLYVAMDFTTATNYLTSTDGLTWTLRTNRTGGTTNYSNIIYHNGYFIASRQGTGGNLQYSNDPINNGWTTVSLGGASYNYKSNIATNGAVAVIVNTLDPSYRYSYDGVNWTLGILPLTGQLPLADTLRWDGRYFVVVSKDAIFFSNDPSNGFNVIRHPTDTFLNASSAYANNGQYFCVKDSADTLLYWYSPNNTRTITNSTIEVEPAMAAVGNSTAIVSVTGQTDLLATDSIDAWIQATDSTADHNAIEHKLAPIKLTVTNIQAGIGFDIVGMSEHRLTGDFKVRWARAS